MKTSITNIELSKLIISHAKSHHTYFMEELNTESKIRKDVASSCARNFKETAHSILTTMFFSELISDEGFEAVFKAIDNVKSDDYIQNLIQAFKECGIDV